MKSIVQNGRKYLFILIILIILMSFSYFELHRYFTLEMLSRYQQELQNWTKSHYFYSVMIYFILFTSLIACGIPCATFLTLLGGFLFGSIAVLYAELATTLGGLCLFLIVRTTFGHILARSSARWIKKLEHGFQENAFNYLLTLRLMPIFPCWMSNISAGVLNVPVKTFLLATMLGIFPSTLIYGLAGRSLDELLSSQIPLSHLLLKPSILLPLIALALLSLLPVLYKSVKKKNKPN